MTRLPRAEYGENGLKRRPSRSKTKNHKQDTLRVVKTANERLQPEIRGLLAVPPQCPKCGCLYIRVTVDTLSGFAVSMVHCPGVQGGCGKTWRLLNSPVRLLPGEKKK
jgi:hypothetical protein